ncbi:MAG TPA: hypothetical protein VKX17_18175 [Planctomycetota bacterium]|nr:hypothetical protein [Planctomycetota bacterium]
MDASRVTFWLRCLGVVLLLSAITARAEQPGEVVDVPKGADPKIKALIEQLGAADTVAREDAEKALLQIGNAAAAQLREAEVSANPEIAARAKRLSARLADAAIQIKSYADVLPADTVLFLEFADAERTVERMKATPLGKLWPTKSMQALITAYRASLIDTELKVFDAINALPKLASGKAMFALASPDTIEAHEIDPPLLYVLESKNPAGVEAQVRAMFEGMNDPVKTKRQYKKFQIEEQVGASTVFGQGRLIHALTTKGMESFLDNLITPPPKPLSTVLAKLKQARPNADLYVRLSGDGLAKLAEANQIIDDEQAGMMDTFGFGEGSFYESALTLNEQGVEEFTRLSLKGAKNKGLLAVLQRMALKPAAANQPQALDLVPFQAALVGTFNGDVAKHSAELAAALRSIDALYGLPLHVDPNLNAQPLKPNAAVVPPKPPAQGETRAKQALDLGGGDLTKPKDPAAMKDKGDKPGDKKNGQPAEPEKSMPHIERLAKAGLTPELLFEQSDGPMAVAFFPERIDLAKLQVPPPANPPADPDHIPQAVLFAMNLKDPTVVSTALEKANVGLEPRFKKQLMNGGDYYAEDPDDENSGGFWMKNNYFAYASSKDIAQLAADAALNQNPNARIAARKVFQDYLANGFDPNALLNVFAESRQYMEMPYKMAQLQWQTPQIIWPDFAVIAGLLKGVPMHIKVTQAGTELQIEAQTPLTILGVEEAIRRPLNDAGLLP